MQAVIVPAAVYPAVDHSWNGPSFSGMAKGTLHAVIVPAAVYPAVDHAPAVFTARSGASSRPLEKDQGESPESIGDSLGEDCDHGDDEFDAVAEYYEALGHAEQLHRDNIVVAAECEAAAGAAVGSYLSGVESVQSVCERLGEAEFLKQYGSRKASRTRATTTMARSLNLWQWPGLNIFMIRQGAR